MNPEQQVGLVKRSKVLKELRHVVRDQESRSGLWSKIKPILDAAKIGDRDDIIMVRNDRKGLVELTVITYRELPGATAKVRVAPLMSISFRGLREIETDNWNECMIETTARLLEFHSVVTASAGDRLDIVTAGKDTLKDQLDAAIRDIFQLSEGSPVYLNEQPLEQSFDDSKSWPVEDGPPPGVFLPIALKWKEIADDFADERRKLELSGSSAWLEKVSVFDRSADIEFYDGPDPSRLTCTLNATTDIQLIEEGLIGTNISNIAQLGLPLYKGLIDRGHGSVITAWTADMARLAGFLTVMKLVSIRRADEDEWHIGIEYMFGFHPGADLDNEAMGNLVGLGLRAALIEDVKALGNSARRHTKHVTIDILLNTPSDRSNRDPEYVLDTVLDDGDTLEVVLPDGIEIGEVLVRIMDKAMLRAARPKGFGG